MNNNECRKDPCNSFASRTIAALAELQERVNTNRQVSQTLHKSIFGAEPEKDGESKDGHDPDSFIGQIEKYLERMGRDLSATTEILEQLNQEFVRS